MTGFRFEHSYAEQLEGMYVEVQPSGFRQPSLLYWNTRLADELGLDASVREASFYSGNRLPEGARPLAMAYAGHQYGHFSPQLGDGRALLLGEHLDPQGGRWDVQLKGSGPTPFSRGGDGLASVGPMLREVLIGEGLHHLGVPGTRSLAVVGTGQTVLRNEELPGAVLARVASSHLRVGTFELFAAQRNHGHVAQLIAYALQRHFPHRVGEERPALALLEEVGRVQGELIAAWMAVGFVHGVMNTDNSTISGQTIDYGPCAFMEAMDPATVFSSIDHHKRYAFGNQPRMGQWNLARLAEALLVHLGDDNERAVDHANAALQTYHDVYSAAYLTQMREKLGLDGADEGDQTLVADLLVHLEAGGIDYTSFFRKLGDNLAAGNLLDPSVPASWAKRWSSRRAPNAAQRMVAVNPLYIPRNHKVEEALDAAVMGDLQPFQTLAAILETPFVAQDVSRSYAEPAPEDFGPYRTFCGT